MVTLVSSESWTTKPDSLKEDSIRARQFWFGFKYSIFHLGFKPESEFQHVDALGGSRSMENYLSKRRSKGLSSRVLEDAQPLMNMLPLVSIPKKKAGGSILEVIDDMIKVGQSMGFTMEGCMNDMEKIIRSQGAHGLRSMVLETWNKNNIDLDDNNKMVRFKKKLQILKKEIRSWVNDCKKNQSGRLVDLRSKLCHIDKVIDQGGVNDDILLTRDEVRDEVLFIGEWSIANLSGITHILHCFSLLSGLSINLKKSHLLGVGIRSEDVNAAALYFGCSTMKTPFKYLGVMVGGNSSTLQAWDDTIGKLKARLSNWKLKTLSVGGRLTLLKSVLGSTPIYNMSIYKVPKSVLQTMESIRRNFFNGVQCDERKIVWIKWAKVLASKKYGGLGSPSHLFLVEIGYGYSQARMPAGGIYYGQPLGSYADWLLIVQFHQINSKLKIAGRSLYITWWSVWMFRNQLLFS
ncbi:hypothetical protein Tco_0336333 [Tanacetum coccineum]